MVKHIKDFATGKPVDIEKPEEPVRQQAEKELINNYNYPKKFLDIEVVIPMGSRRPRADIVVFDQNKNPEGVIEVKAPGSNQGVDQLESYIQASTAKWGWWTNGTESKYAIKNEDNVVVWEDKFNIPRYGQSEEEKITYQDLQPAENLKRLFENISSWLYTNSDMMRKDQQGAKMVRLLFCKLQDEYKAEADPDYELLFQTYRKQKPSDLQKNIRKLWKDAVGSLVTGGVFDVKEDIDDIDKNALLYVVKELQFINLTETESDVVGEAFEVFIDRQFAGDHGQFFTPRNAVRMAIAMINPVEGETIIDPTCGAGGFLIGAFEHLTKNVKDPRRKSQIAHNYLYGVDKDSTLFKLCRAQMAMIGDGKSNIARGDSLNKDEWDGKMKDIMENEYDILVANPPFGSKIKVEDKKILNQYELAFKNSNGETKPTPPEILFVERSIELLKEGGRAAIVLPKGIFGNAKYNNIRHFIDEKCDINAVIDMPSTIFLPHTDTKTSLLVITKRKKKSLRSKTFFGIAINPGHTRRGRATEINDLSTIGKNYNYYIKNGRCKKRNDPLGFVANRKKDDDRLLAPRFYDPKFLNNTFNISKFKELSIGDMIDNNLIELSGISKGPSEADYDDEGEIRFIRTTDISNFEILRKSIKYVSYSTFKKYKESQDIKFEDILMVKSGRTRIGETAIVSENDKEICVQGGFYKIRVIDNEIDPYLLIALLNTKFVKQQIDRLVFDKGTLAHIALDRMKKLNIIIPKNKSDLNNLSNKFKQKLNNRRNQLDEANSLIDGIF